MVGTNTNVLFAWKYSMYASNSSLVTPAVDPLHHTVDEQGEAAGGQPRIDDGHPWHLLGDRPGTLTCR